MKRNNIIIIFLLVCSTNLFFPQDVSYKSQNFKKPNNFNLESSSSENSSDLYAVIIGISDYPGTNNDLQFSSQDAERFYTLLIGDYGCSPERIYYFIDDNATYSDIISTFDEISQKIDGNDKFILYFAGRGMVDDPLTQNFSVDIQTAHNYGNYVDLNWNITHPGATGIRVHFSRFETENYYDYLDVGDVSETGSAIYQERYTGNEGTDFWTGFIPTFNDSISLNFRSNSFGVDWGFTIDNYQIINESSQSQGLCPYDYNYQNFYDFINETLLYDLVQNLTSSKKYLFLDSSFSGGIIDEFTSNNVVILTSTDAFEFNIEDEESQSGCFSQFVFQGLSADQYNFLIPNEIDSNSDGFNSMEEIYIYSNFSSVQRSQDISEKRIIHPQYFNQNHYDTFIFPAIFNVNFNVTGINLDYNFTMDGISYVDSINLLIWSSFDNTFKNYSIDPSSISESGYGNYTGLINNGKIISSVGIVSQVIDSQNISSQIFSFQPFDFDNDNLTDIHEIFLSSNPALNDTDSDDLFDFDEYEIGTQINNNDSDNDGIPDGYEVIYSFNPLDNLDNLSDPDHDGLGVLEEYTSGTDPRDIDTDKDTIPDGYEIWGSLNPLSSADRFEDLDGDGMLNVYEYYNKSTNPNKADSDDDGINDFWEWGNGTEPWEWDTDKDFLSDGEELLNYSTNPLEEDSDFDDLSDFSEIFLSFTDPLNSDSDSDGILDGPELIIYNTNATNPDSDSDGILDGEEIIEGVDGYITNPLNRDTDGDGFDDKYEIFWNTDPTNPERSPLLIGQLTVAAWIIGIFTGLVVLGKIERKIRDKKQNKNLKKHK